MLSVKEMWKFTATLFENKVFNKATHLEQANHKIRLKRVFLVNSFIRNKLITSKINERQKFLAFEQLQWLGINIINFTNINFYTCSQLSENSNIFLDITTQRNLSTERKKLNFGKKRLQPLLVQYSTSCTILQSIPNQPCY